jgi:opacity protein-like surface antigen
MMRRLGVMVALACALAACERPQDMSQVKKADQPAWQGASGAVYAAPNWTSGDAKSWEKQINTRAQAQNEYARLNVGK